MGQAWASVSIDWRYVRAHSREHRWCRDRGRRRGAEISVSGSRSMMAELSREAAPETHAPRSRRSHWQLRATALADTRGRVVAMVAVDGSAQRDVAEYFADRYCCLSGEAVGIDLHGGVLSSSLTGGQTAEGQSTMRLTKIVVLDCDTDSPPDPTIEHLDLESALQALVPMSRGLRKLEAPLRTIDAVLAATGGAALIRYGHPATLSSSLAELLELEPPSRPVRIRPVSAFGVVDLQASRDSFFRSAVIDAISLEFEKTAVLLPGVADDELRILEKVESDVWNAASGSPREKLKAAWVLDGARDDRHHTRGLDEVLRNMVSDGLLSHDPAWRIGDDVAWTLSRDRVTVLNLDESSPQPISLEGSASIIWSIMAENGSILQSRLIEDCAASVGIDASVITDDVISVLHALQSRGVVVPC